MFAARVGIRWTFAFDSSRDELCACPNPLDRQFRAREVVGEQLLDLGLAPMGCRLDQLICVFGCEMGSEHAYRRQIETALRKRGEEGRELPRDRKSTRLNSSHTVISY